MTSAPRSIRFSESTLEKLASFTARHPAMTSSSAAALFVDEGLRMDEHPGILFREGPTGRRACLAGGPDVWEVVRSVRATRAAEPGMDSGQVLELVAENTGLGPSSVRQAITYYSAFAEEIDGQIAAATEAEARLALAVQQTNRLLGGA
jgi:hypothetical protein